jgi:hypothetical protein
VVRRPCHAVFILVGVLLLAGCATRTIYHPATPDEVGFLERAQEQTRDSITVKVAVPSPEEARALLGFKADKKGIQPIWIEIANKSDHNCWFVAHALDPEYYSALEVAWMGRKRYTKNARRQMERQIYSQALPLLAPASETTQGYVFVNQTLGARRVFVELWVADRDVLRFDFLVHIPGLETDYLQVDFEDLYDEFEDLDLDGLRNWIEAQPASVTNKKETQLGDPLNLVVVGTSDSIWPAFVRSRWHVTETMTASSVWKTVSSSVFRRRYLYSPVSALYVYGRPQDIALQKARATVDERNHLRLWLAPVTYQGRQVWIGQISRDIGVRLTKRSPTLTTHKIDPNVDETRTSLVQELIYAQGVSAAAYARGVGPAPITAPRGNLTGDPYFTDGLRAVIFTSEKRVPVKDVHILDWELPQKTSESYN